MENSSEEEITETPVVEAIGRIHSTAKAEISASAGKIQEAIVNKMVDLETTRRIDMAYTAVKRVEDLQKQFDSINRPDNTLWDASGAEMKTFTKARRDQIAKDGKVLNELKSALEKALTENSLDSYEKLKQKLGAATASSGGDKSGGDKGKGESTSS